MKKLNKQDVELLVDCLTNGKEIPESYKYIIFPTKQKEYELVYAGKMRKEDVLADAEEAKPVPLQVEKIFNGKKHPRYSESWNNLLVFGDNLQILKTFYENKDPLIKNRVKGKVKLIYIDPPFATTDEFQNKEGAKAYNDKKKGAEFVEFLRRRLILAREILADDGNIYVHLDQKMSHYIKVVMDEIFGKNYFKNEIVWSYFVSGKYPNNFARNHANIYVYSKTNNSIFNYQKYFDKYLYFEKHYTGNVVKKGDGKEYYEYNGELRTFEKQLSETWTDITKVKRDSKSEKTGYPTQKPEALLARIIKASSNEGDIVMDFFCGSGTTLAVAEKLNRRWIGCDIGKLAMYTIQKRLLEIEQSGSLEDLKKKYGKPAKSFAMVTSGFYDLRKVFSLKKNEYIRFVKDLFEIAEIKEKKISGIEIDGKKREFYVKIFPYWDFENASVDEEYLQGLHESMGKKIDSRFYIIAPANNIDFINDYHQIDSVRYYFLRVPYQVIKELHKVPFKKLRQPQSKNQINDLDEAIGFHFIRQPEVKTEIKKLEDKVILKIKKFESAYLKDNADEKLKNFESLAMLLIDLNYDGEKFMLSTVFFDEELRQNQMEIKNGDLMIEGQAIYSARQKTVEWKLADCGKQVMIIYIDVYGNEFREKFDIE